VDFLGVRLQQLSSSAELARERKFRKVVVSIATVQKTLPKSIWFECGLNRANFHKSFHQSQYWATHKTLAQMILC
jgi:hypothetical protein